MQHGRLARPTGKAINSQSNALKLFGCGVKCAYQNPDGYARCRGQYACTASQHDNASRVLMGALNPMCIADTVHSILTSDFWINPIVINSVRRPEPDWIIARAKSELPVKVFLSRAPG